MVKTKKIKNLALIALSLLSITIIIGCVAPSKPLLSSVFNELNQAEQLSSKGKYTEAAALYEEIIAKDTIINSKLYFNCANNFYRSNNMGKAIFFYLKALRLDPYNKKIKANLSIARTDRDGGWSQNPPTSLFTITNNILTWVPLKLRLILFLFGTTAFWGLLTLKLLKKRPQKKYLFYILGFLTLFVGLTLCFDLTKPFHPKEGVALGSVEGRSGDNSSAPPLFNEPLSPGVEFTILQERAGWFFVKLKRGGECWVKSTAIGVLEY